MKDWDDFLKLFAGEKASVRQFTVLKKEGQTNLYLPPDRKMAETTLRLYPAQSLYARSLVVLVRGLMRVGIRVSRQRVGIAVDENAAFSQFLQRVVPESKGVPTFGIFENRIKESGRPYVLLLSTANGQPTAVVKVGTSPEAQRLIKTEQQFFFPKRPQFPRLPEALDQYVSDGVNAIAYRYVEGFSPKPPQHGEVGSLLSSWVRDDEIVRLSELPVWARLENLLQDNPILTPIFKILQDSRVKPVLAHGDFAPWNIRTSSSARRSKWIVLDWERGEHRGIPGWDWFNFIVQYNIWVERLSPDATLVEIEALWDAPAFQAYARQTGIEPIIKELTFVYLLYSIRYCNPHAKTGSLRVLARKFNKKYFPDVVLTHRPLTISVVTPSYKQLPWLKLCAASVADQTGVAVEHIIQDAQSGPELDEWVKENTKAKLFVECDSGMYDAINRGFARTTGDIICWLNSDEQYLEGTLAKVARYFETHPEIDVLFGDALLVSNNGTLISYRRTIRPNLLHIQAAHLNTLSCATFIRRSVLEQGFTLDTRWKAIADAVWIVSMLKAGMPMAILKEPLAVFTITDKNLGQTSLALSEVKLWQEETASENTALRPFIVTWHRLTKLASGAYWPRSLSTRLYTLGSPQKRVDLEAHHIGFSWPRST